MFSETGKRHSSRNREHSVLRRFGCGRGKMYRRLAVWSYGGGQVSPWFVVWRDCEQYPVWTPPQNPSEWPSIFETTKYIVDILWIFEKHVDHQTYLQIYRVQYGSSVSFGRRQVVLCVGSVWSVYQLRNGHTPIIGGTVHHGEGRDAQCQDYCLCSHGIICPATFEAVSCDMISFTDSLIITIRFSLRISSQFTTHFLLFHQLGSFKSFYFLFLFWGSNSRYFIFKKIKISCLNPSIAAVYPVCVCHITYSVYLIICLSLSLYLGIWELFGNVRIFW